MDSAAARKGASKAAGGKTDVRFRSQFRKTELCAYFEKGYCSKGESCAYAHGAAELQHAPDLTKTSLCKKWLQFSCKNGSDECPFAHGWHELRATDAYIRKPQGRKAGASSAGAADAATFAVDRPSASSSIRGSRPGPLTVALAPATLPLGGSHGSLCGVPSTPSSATFASLQDLTSPHGTSPTLSPSGMSLPPTTPSGTSMTMMVPIVFLGPMHHAAHSPAPGQAPAGHAAVIKAPGGGVPAGSSNEALAEILRRAMPEQYED